MNLPLPNQKEHAAGSIDIIQWMSLMLLSGLLLLFCFPAHANDVVLRMEIIGCYDSLTPQLNSGAQLSGFPPADFISPEDDVSGNEFAYHIKVNEMNLLFMGSNEETPSFELHGRVVNEKNEPLPGVSIVISGTKKGTTTDKDGRFSLDIPENKTVFLEFSNVGYQTKRIRVTGEDNITITLSLEVTGLSDVVVVGYGTQKKSDLTGSITKISSDEFTKGVNKSIDDLLRGKAAGVQVVQNGAQPGGGVSISIRGASSINAGTGPLFVIDGLPIDNSPVITATGANYVNTPSPPNPLSNINPDDIASIEVLKDASATAIYGARGANGVIMITTRIGKQGTSAVNYNVYLGVQNIYRYLPLLNAQQYKTTLNNIISEGGGTSAEMVEEIENGGTDWQKAISNANALVQNHEISFSGSNGKTSYLASLGYFDQDGVIISSSFKRYNARLNLHSQLSDRFDIGLHLVTSYSKNDMVPVGFGFNELAGAMYAAYNFDPTLTIKDPAGKYEHSPYITIDNPVALALGKNSFSNNYRTLGTLYGNYKILPSLSAKINIGGDINTESRNVYIDKTTLDGLAGNGIASLINGQHSNYLMEATLTFDKTYVVHRITVLGGMSTQKFIHVSNSSEASGFPSDALGTNSMGSGTQTTYNVGSGKASNSLLSYIGRVNYSYKNKYLLTGTFRADGSSRFGENNKIGFFPSVAAGWKIDHENFMKNIKVINELKLRASWGQTGNQEIGNYQSIVTFASGPNAVFNEQQVSTQEPARLANPNLKWETTTQTNIGLDFSILSGRLSGSVDYYQKKTTDMLVDLPVPTSTGFNSILSNVGSMRNEGFEFSIQSQNLKGAFSWNTTATLTTLKNKVLNLGKIPQIITGSAGVVSQISIISPGLPLQSFYGYKIIGVWQTDDDFSQTKDHVAPGDLKYLDINEDGMVNADDRVILGNSFPSLSWSLINHLSYKNLSVDFDFIGVQNFKMLNNNLVDTYFPVNFRRNKLAKPYLNRWTTQNPSDKYPSFVTPLNQGQKSVNSYTVEDASYVKLQAVTISYNLRFLHNLQTIYVTGQNLLTFTNYDGIDPSLNPAGNANFRIDFNAYPSSQTFLLGIKLHL